MVGPAESGKLAALLEEYGENDTHIAALDAELLKKTPIVKKRLEGDVEPPKLPLLTKENAK